MARYAAGMSTETIGIKTKSTQTFGIKTGFRVAALAAALAFSGCAGMTASQILANVDSVLNGVCSSLTFLPYEVAVCAGVQGAETLANLINGYISKGTIATKLAKAHAEHKAKATPAGGWTCVKINGLPAYAPPEVAAVLNDPLENAALRAYIAAGLAQKPSADAGVGDASAK